VKGNVKWYKIILFLILVAAGYKINLFVSTRGMGQVFFPAGILIMLIFLSYPFPAALGASVLINLSFWGTWRFLPFLILSLSELLFLRLIRRKRVGSIVVSDAVFWITGGLLLTWGLSFFLLKLSFQSSLILFSFFLMNGITCVTFASISCYAWYLFKVRVLKKNEESPFFVKNLLFNFMTMGILVFFFYILEVEHISGCFREEYIFMNPDYSFPLLTFPAGETNWIMEQWYLRKVIILMGVLYGSIFIAYYFSRLLGGPISELSRIVEALSREEMEEVDDLPWPVSTLREIQELVESSKTSYGNILERNLQLLSLNRSLEYAACHDGLTKLPNRSFVLKKMRKMIESHSKFALVCLDLNGFKMFNDTHGHRVGDLLLVEFAARLNSLGPDIHAARLGGDEFVLIMDGLDSAEELNEKMDILLKAISKPIEERGNLHLLHISTGIAFCPRHGDSVTDLLRNADLAMYKVKTERQCSWHIYSEELDCTLTHFEIEKGIHHAFENNQFELYYQPQVDIRTGKIVSLEALIRWDHPEKGFISPALFIPLAEKMDIIIPIGYWVIEEAARRGASWVAQGFKGVISVNVSPRQFAEPDLFIKTKAILEEVGLAPRFFGIEVTETMVMRNAAFTNGIISQFMEYGIHVSMDDFGTGYTSLSLLQELNVDTLKIDQTFVEKVGHSRKNEIVLNHLINLTRELEMEIVVEGVETEEQNAFFRDRSCYTAQGFLHHKPLPPEELEKVLKERSDFI
jgi:diguanylate cyclase (GGDEF)-like protein